MDGHQHISYPISQLYPSPADPLLRRSREEKTQSTGNAIKANLSFHYTPPPNKVHCPLVRFGRPFSSPTTIKVFASNNICRSSQAVVVLPLNVPQFRMFFVRSPTVEYLFSFWRAISAQSDSCVYPPTFFCWQNFSNSSFFGGFHFSVSVSISELKRILCLERQIMSHICWLYKNDDALFRWWCC